MANQACAEEIQAHTQAREEAEAESCEGGEAKHDAGGGARGRGDGMSVSGKHQVPMTPEDKRDFVFGKYAGVSGTNSNGDNRERLQMEGDDLQLPKAELESDSVIVKEQRQHPGDQSHAQTQSQRPGVVGPPPGSVSPPASDLDYNGQRAASADSDGEDFGSMGIQSRSDDLMSELDLDNANDDAFLQSLRARSKQSSATSGHRKSPRKSGQVSRTVVSRARPLKPHESSPFLSIDNLPVGKQVVNNKPVTPAGERGQKPASGRPLYRPSPAENNIIRGGYRASGSSSDWNALIPGRHKQVAVSVSQQNNANCQVKAPFKHAVNKPDTQKTRRSCSPSQALKENTAMATLQVARSMSRQKVPRENKVQGRLLKSRLKPMNVVKVEGPGMEYCRGIVAAPRMKVANEDRPSTSADEHNELVALWREYYGAGCDPDRNLDSFVDSVTDTRSHQPSQSKTLQRRRHILNTIAKEYLYERPQTVESIHRTSIASDLTDNRMDDLKHDLQTLEAEGETDEAEDCILGPPVDGLRMPPNSLVSLADPSRGTVCNGQYVHSGQPLHEEADDITGTVPDEGQMRDTSEGQDQGQDNGYQGQGQGREIHSRAEESSIDQQALQESQGSSSITGPPLLQESQTAGITRPQTVHDSQSRKAVRFADQSDPSQVHVHRSRSAMPRLSGTTQSEKEQDGSTETKRKKRTTRAGCREPVIISSQTRDDSGDEDDAKREGGPPKNNPDLATLNSASQRRQQGQHTEPSGESQQNQQQDTLRVSFNDVVYGFEDPKSTAARPSSPHRPRSQLGLWEDHQRPDTDVSDLSVAGSGVGAQESCPLLPAPPKSKPKHATSSYNRVVGKSGAGRQRPQSAGPTTGSLSCSSNNKKETKKGAERQRPFSAHTVNVNIQDFMVTGRESQLNEASGNDSQRILHNKMPLKSALKAQRQASSAAEVEMAQPEFSVQGEKIKESGSCMYCGEITMKSAHCTSDAGSISVFLCESCRDTSMARDTEAAQDDAAAVAAAGTDEEDGLDIIEDDDVEDLTYFDDNVTCDADRVSPVNTAAVMATSQKDIQIQREIDVQNLAHDLVQEVIQEEIAEQAQAFDPDSAVSAEVQQEILIQDVAYGLVSEVVEGVARQAMTSGGLDCFDQLEQSLINVQAEIQEQTGQCPSNDLHLETYGSDKVNKKMESSKAEHTGSEHDKVTTGAEVENSESPQETLMQTQMSEHLIGPGSTPSAPGQYTMTVYHYSEKGEECASSSSDGPEAGTAASETAAESGQIDTYDVTMVGSKNLAGIGNLTSVKATEANCRASGSDSLQVKATSKALNQHKSQKNTADILAPFAPLCFRVNARPPAGYLYYFAYGMDMNANRLSSYIQRSVVEHAQWGLLYGFQLAFNKTGVSRQAGGFPNIQFCPTSSVEGALYLITPQELGLLDRIMGYPEHYHHVMLPVWLLNCSEPDDLGVAQYCVPALMYIARDRWLQHDQKTLSTSYAVDQCLKAGSLMTPSYRQQLASMRRNS